MGRDKIKTKTKTKLSILNDLTYMLFESWNGKREEMAEFKFSLNLRNNFPKINDGHQTSDTRSLENSKG